MEDAESPATPWIIHTISLTPTTVGYRVAAEERWPTHAPNAWDRNIYRGKEGARPANNPPLTSVVFSVPETILSVELLGRISACSWGGWFVAS